jgi:hypothetical protein
MKALTGNSLTNVRKYAYRSSTIHFNAPDLNLRHSGAQRLHLTLPPANTFPSRLSSACCTGERFLLTATDAAAGLNACSGPAPLSPSRNVPAGLNTCTSLFFTLRPDYLLRVSCLLPVALDNSSLLTIRDASAGLNSCTTASLEECSQAGQAQHLHLTLPHTEMFSELPACRWPAGSTGELFLLAATDAAAGLNSCTAASLEECSGRGSTPAPHSSLH